MEFTFVEQIMWDFFFPKEASNYLVKSLKNIKLFGGCCFNTQLIQGSHFWCIGPSLIMRECELASLYVAHSMVVEQVSTEIRPCWAKTCH